MRRYFPMKQILCVLLALLSINQVAFADGDPCERAVTTIEINACVKAKLDAADQKLNATYKQVIDLLNQPDGLGRSQVGIKNQLIKAQRLWVNFRDKNCDVVWALNADGTVRTSLYLGCKVDLTLQREEQLRKWALSYLVEAK